MALISSTNLIALTDKLAAIYDRLRVELGIHSGSAVAGTDRYLAEDALAVLTTLTDDYQQQSDLSQPFYTATLKHNRKEFFKSFWQTAIASLQDHMSQRGSLVSTTIVDLSTYLTYLNTTPNSALLHPVFGDLYYDLYGVRLPAAGLMQPGIHPYLNSSYTNAMGTKTTAGTFTDGAACEATPLYSYCTLLAEVTVNFSGGAAAPVVTVAGTDHTGATSTTWSGTFTGNNPTAAVSTTITPAVTAMARQTAAVASATGIAIGSVMKINDGLVDEEIVIIENVSGSDLTFSAYKAHNAGAALTGFNSLVLAPSVSNRRCSDVSGITLTLSSHSAGTVRIVGVQDRQYKP